MASAKDPILIPATSTHLNQATTPFADRAAAQFNNNSNSANSNTNVAGNYSTSIGTAALARTPSRASSYFPSAQQRHQLSADRDRIASASPVLSRPGRFTEEWDASQRGSSIIDGPAATTSNNMSIQRSNSVSGSILTGDVGSGQVPSRSNTLKKKASMRRTGSLRRSSSRRSMKAGSVRSLAVQSATDQDEMHNAFFCPVPTTGNPTEALANRFQGECLMIHELMCLVGNS
jgi:hypothetical protein